MPPDGSAVGSEMVGGGASQTLSHCYLKAEHLSSGWFYGCCCFYEHNGKSAKRNLNYIYLFI